MKIRYVYFGFKICIKTILAVINTTYVVVKIWPEKKIRPIQDLNP